MCPRMFMLLIGAVHIYYQVFSADVKDVYVGELMVGSNVTLEASIILSVLKMITVLQVHNTSEEQPKNVILSHSELVAECLIVGDKSTCKCFTEYIWSNVVCYEYNCCREIACTQNVSHITPLCVAKVKVQITGSVILNGNSWESSKTKKLVSNFEDLNGFEYLNVTSQRQENTVADFEAAVSVKFKTSKLQSIVTKLESILGAQIVVKTEGMVTIKSPENTVCYESEQVLNCIFEEKTDGAVWYMSRKNQRFELNTGSVVQLNYDCTTNKYSSCVKVTLQNVTGIWAGSYECGFTSGSVSHTAKTQLSVTLLPDVISLNIEPLTADCSEKGSSDNVPIKVSAIIANSTERFQVWWSLGDKTVSSRDNTSNGDDLFYTFIARVTCKKTIKAQSVTVTFKNVKGQTRSARLDIPVIYGARYCDEEEFWPKTPEGNTVINNTCAAGRVGYKSRTCKGTTWKTVYNYCVKEELIAILNDADNFRKGLGASQKVAREIFESLKNSSESDYDSTDSMADTIASIHILNLMAEASVKIPLEEGVLNDFVDAASNMLNNTWNGVNISTAENISSKYLESVESLVKNIKVNTSNEFFSPNLDLKFCKNADCDVNVFGIGVNMNKTAGIMKTLAVKNLMNKLRNNIDKTKPTSLLISVTLEDRKEPSLKVRLKFPLEKEKSDKPLCVFWNTTLKKWSEAGCSVTSDGNGTVCECDHLTSFSVLMAKGDISTDELDIITNVGLGVSVCSLLIFLIVEYLVWTAVVKTNLSHFRHTAIVNIAMFLLLADCSFLASSSPKSLSKTWCLVLTICKHLFFLAMFNWMLCMSVMLVHQLIFVFSPLRKRVFLFLSSIVGYLCPILIVGSSYVHCKYTNRPYYDEETCWLVYERLLEGSIHAFLLPVGTVLLTNLFSMVVVILTLVKSSVPDGGKADDKETVKSILKVVVILTPVFGATWIIGFALLLIDKDEPIHIVANYSFTILNSFQGLFILITGCFAEQKVREEMVKLIMAKSKGKSESTKNLMSTTYTKDK